MPPASSSLGLADMGDAHPLGPRFDAGRADLSPGEREVANAPLAGPAVVTVGRPGKPVCGYTWRLWSRSTSFYLKARVPDMKHLKLSIHGDDPRHPAGGGFKLAMDPEDRYTEAVEQGTIRARRFGDWPIWFTGVPINDKATRVVRMRWTWDCCARMGAAPDPGDLRRGATGVLLRPPPAPGDAVDLDLVVSSDEPYWPHESDGRRRGALLGPLRNDSGQWLTGTVFKRNATLTPPPAAAIGPTPRGAEDQVRGVGFAVGADGLLWIVEQRMSESIWRSTPAS